MFALVLLPLVVAAPVSLAATDPCVPFTQRPVGPRLSLWDVTEGRIEDRDVEASRLRLNGLVELTNVTLPSGIPSREFAEMRVRIAELYAAEGRFQTRCHPESDQAEEWFKRAVSVTTLILERDPDVGRRSLVLRARADALCGLARWEECATVLQELMREAADPQLAAEILVWSGDSLRDASQQGAAVEAYRQATVGAPGPAATYAMYNLAWAQHHEGATDAAIGTMGLLVQAEASRTSGRPVSIALQAAILDFPSLRESPADTRAIDALSELSALVSHELLKPAKEGAEDKSNPVIVRDVVSELLPLEMLYPAFDMLVALDRDCHTDDLGSRKRRSRAERAADRILESELAQLVQVAEGVRDRDATRSPASAQQAGALACQAATLYLKRFPRGPNVHQIDACLDRE